MIKTKSFYVVIPARYASTRLPGKALLDIGGKSMIQRVYEQAQQSSAEEVVVATDDERVQAAVRDFGGQVMLTAATHESGTDRVHEVCRINGWADDAVVVGVQGDEPLVPPCVIDQVAHNAMANTDYSMATLCEKIDEPDVFLDPNAVKVVTDENGRALYFSRAPIPWPRDALKKEMLANAAAIPLLPLERCYRHIGIYAYRVSLLNRFVTWPIAPLEAVEKLEQLRVLWHGEAIHVAQAVETIPPGVDTEDDLLRVRRLVEGEN